MSPWLKQNNTAVITGGASGIGLAAAARFLSAGMNVLIADRDDDALKAAEQDLRGSETGALLTQRCDVSVADDVTALAETAHQQFGTVHCLMNNAGTGFPPAKPWEALEQWKRQLDVNLWGIVHGCQAFVPAMLSHGERAVVINTGSKQGITNPPGNYAYNLSKAGVRAYTESLAHALREESQSLVTAHLLVPGFTFTGMIKRFIAEQPPGAWTPEQVVDFMLESLARGDFYVLCPDNETPRALDEKRMLWNTLDIVENRSALSRWDPAFKDAYERFVTDET
ncbi:MAG: SDR family NAD(P)-dependent oxidoreductase [Pseudomonadota bacterium]